MTDTAKEDAPAQGEKPPRDLAPLERWLGQRLPVAGPLLVLAAAVVGGVLRGPPGVMLALSAGALLAVIWILWASLRTFLGETPLEGADAYALAAPRAEEEQKRAVLRALKDLEFERGVGKISEEDYEALVAKYRAEGKRLLQKLDNEAAPRRERVERLIAQRLRKEGLAALKESQAARAARVEEAPSAAEGDAGDDGAEPEPTPEERAPAEGPGASRSACAGCGTENDADAVFCKKCGKRQLPEPTSAAEDTSP